MATPFPDPRRWWALFLLCAAQFIVILDTSIVGIALPAIQAALGFAPADLQWVFNAYVIAFGGLLLLGGRTADLFGSRRLFMAGFATLSGASLLAGLAWSAEVLVGARALQGLGAALIAPAALSILMGLFARDPRELAKAFGFWGASAAAGGTAGVFLGGVITEWASWRWTFLVNVPLGAAVLVAAPLVLRAGLRQRGGVDYAGALAITGALVLAVYALVTGHGAGWASAQTVGLLAVAAVLLVAFVAIQATRREPLVPLSVFAAPNLSVGNLVMALLGASWIPGWFFLNLYLQQVLGYSALNSGLALLPMTVAIMALMVGLTARLVGRFGFKANLVAGLVLLAASMLLFARVTVDGSFLVDVLPASLLGALGMSLAYIPATIAGMSGAKPEQTGLASGLINTTYQIGSALGLAAMTAVAYAGTESATYLSGDAQLLSGFQAAFVGAATVAGVAALVALLAVRAPRAAAAPLVEEEVQQLRAA